MAEGNFLDQLSGYATDLGSGGLFEIFQYGIFQKVYIFLKIVFWFVVFAGGAIALWKYYFQFKIRIILHKKVGFGGEEVVLDSAKIVTDEQNKTKLVLFKTKKGKKRITCPIPEGRYKFKMGKFDAYQMELDDNLEVHPIEKAIVDVSERNKLLVRPQERSAWGRMEDEIIFKKFQKKDALLKYAAPAILLTAMITAFLIWFFAAKELGAGLQALASEFRQVAASCTRIS